MTSVPRMNRARAAVLAVGAMLLAASSGCASSAEHRAGAAEPSIAADHALHDQLPASVRDRGVLRVVTDASYAPASSFAQDGRTIIGFEPDLGAALGKVLGVRVQFSDRDFDQLPGLVSSGRAELIMSAMTDTKDREKGLDFVDYFSAGTSLVVQRGNPHGISDLGSLCGQVIAVENGTVQADLLEREQQHCGGRPIKILTARTNDDALLAVRTGRAAAIPMDFPPAELLTTAAKTTDLFQLASTEQYEPGPYGIGVAKDQTQLRDTVQAALGRLMKTGAYRAVLDKWHVVDGALGRATVNAG